MAKSFYVTKIHSVMELEWQPRSYTMTNRPVHALSVRLIGNADFYHGEECFSGKTGDVIYFPKQYDYLQIAHGEERIICLNFDLADGDFFEPIILRPVLPELYFEDFYAMLRIWTEKKSGYENATLAILNRVFEALVSQTTKTRPMEQAISYINRNFTSPELSVCSIAEMMGISETYLRKLFFAEMGVTPHRYIARLRLEHAIQLLNSGYYSVEQTALCCGFRNAKNFSTFIRHETGKTPTMLRR